jgi:hypothetical protein
MLFVTVDEPLYFLRQLYGDPCIFMSNIIKNKIRCLENLTVLIVKKKLKR